MITNAPPYSWVVIFLLCAKCLLYVTRVLCHAPMLAHAILLGAPVCAFQASCCMCIYEFRGQDKWEVEVGRNGSQGRCRFASYLLPLVCWQLGRSRRLLSVILGL